MEGPSGSPKAEQAQMGALRGESLGDHCLGGQKKSWLEGGCGSTLIHWQASRERPKGTCGSMLGGLGLREQHSGLMAEGAPLEWMKGTDGQGRAGSTGQAKRLSLL